jgi:hypothetical protein
MQTFSILLAPPQKIYSTYFPTVKGLLIILNCDVYPLSMNEQILVAVYCRQASKRKGKYQTEK